MNLKPLNCICGKPPEVKKGEYVIKPKKRWYVECGDSKCHLHPISMVAIQKTSAIQNWNRMINNIQINVKSGGLCRLDKNDVKISKKKRK